MDQIIIRNASIISREDEGAKKSTEGGTKGKVMAEDENGGSKGEGLIKVERHGEEITQAENLGEGFGGASRAEAEQKNVDHVRLDLLIRLIKLMMSVGCRFNSQSRRGG